MNAASPSAAQARRRLLLIAGLLLLTLAVFLPVRTFDFAPFDDEAQIITNPRLLQFSPDNLRWMFTDTTLTQRYTPLSWITWSLVAHAGGIRPAPFHLFAIAVHLVGALLVFLLLDTMLARLASFRDQPTFRHYAAAFAAAFWALHPMRAEVVAWATQVRYAEAHACAVAALLLYFRARALPGPLFRRGTFWCAVALYVASILFYPSALLLPLLLPLIDRCFFPPAPGDPRPARFAALIPFLPFALLVGLMTLAGRYDNAGSGAAPLSLQQFSLFDRLSQAASTTSFFLWKPFAFRLFTPVYPTLIDHDPRSALHLFNLALVVAAALIAAFSLKRRPFLSLVIAAHFLLLLPFGGYFERPYILGDRYNYLHAVLLSALLAAALGCLTPRLSPPLRKLLPAIGVLALLALGYRAYRQTEIWRDPETTVRFSLSHVENTSFAAELHWQLARTLMFKGRFQEAVAECDRSLVLHPREPSLPHAVKAEIFSRVAASLEAEQAPLEDIRQAHYLAAKSMDAALGDAPAAPLIARIARAYLAAGRIDLARQRLTRALELDPNRTEDRRLLAALPASASAPSTRP